MSSGGRRGEDWLCEQQTEDVRLCVRVVRRLVRRRTELQELDLVQTESLGRVMALDGKLMLSERDEPFYHEMLVHPAMLSHPGPRDVLVVGGGDGGTLREVLRHPTVEHATLAEIDQQVIDTAREALPEVHRGALDDSRVNVIVCPGEDFLPQNPDAYDVILVDSTDPVGPGEALFAEGFFRNCHVALRPGGMLALQAGTPFYWPDELVAVNKRLSGVLPHVCTYLGFVPVYPSGMWAYVLGSDDYPLAQLEELESRYQERCLATRYYTPALHHGALALPRFVEELLAQARSSAT
ncbi:MAG: polyamine aminopropyltransferase [Candidatus Bipolaricaulota bacterium]